MRDLIALGSGTEHGSCCDEWRVLVAVPDERASVGLMSERPEIPVQLKRDVLVEAGHRCAIPACKAIPVEIAHIEPWTKVKAHTFDNLIALCPTCHARYDSSSGGIDRKAMRQYKANLGVLTSRYGEIERRFLEEFIERPDCYSIQMPAASDLLMLNLVRDGMAVRGFVHPSLGLIVPNGASAVIDFTGIQET